MKSFAVQLQEYVDTIKNEEKNRLNFKRNEKVRLISHMVDLLEILGVISGKPVSLINKNMMLYLLVNKYYKDPK